MSVPLFEVEQMKYDIQVKSSLFGNRPLASHLNGFVGRMQSEDVVPFCVDEERVCSEVDSELLDWVEFGLLEEFFVVPILSVVLVWGVKVVLLYPVEEVIPGASVPLQGQI